MRKKLQPHQKHFIEAIALALVIFLLPFAFYQPPYDQLEEAVVTIQQTDYRVGTRTISAYVRTADGTTYKVGGKISSRAEFEQLLTPGATAVIKYYRGLSVVIPTRFIEELTADGRTIISEHNNQPILCLLCGISGSVILLFGFLFYADSAHIFRNLRRKCRDYVTKKK